LQAFKDVAAQAIHIYRLMRFIDPATKYCHAA
jgi:hypothetical protein